MSLSIVMPCYNESQIIESVVEDYYNNIIKKLDQAELIVIDDNSSDGSFEKLKILEQKFDKLKILQSSFSNGHGKAILLGYKEAQYDWVFQIDSDNQFYSEDFWKLYHLREKYDFLLGVRVRRCDPPLRLLLTHFVRISNAIVFGVWIKDSNCPYRLMKNSTLKKSMNAIKPDALLPNIMIAILLKKRKIPMQEVDVRHIPRRTGTASISLIKLCVYIVKGWLELFRFRISRSYA